MTATTPTFGKQESSINVVDGQQLIADLRAHLNRALQGKADVIELVLACLLANGHLLLEDMPGLGKTTLAKAIATGIGGQFARVQCTPDLLPGDITGFSVFNQKTREFEFMTGPVFSNVLLADEINRTSPRTQSALLEAMAERQVTVDNTRHELPATFFVIATQNPLEHHGTYPLPEAQLDRFTMKLSVGYPDRTAELDLLTSALGSNSQQKNASAAVFQPEDLLQLQKEVQNLTIQRSVLEYLVDLARTTRNHPRIALGLSPRGLLIWQRVAQAWAYLHHRSFVTPQDIQEVASPVLGVRLGLTSTELNSVIPDLIQSVAVPI
ncbi:MAG: MoxR family ATPase [Zavarzinella sp.]